MGGRLAQAGAADRGPDAVPARRGRCAAGPAGLRHRLWRGSADHRPGRGGGADGAGGRVRHFGAAGRAGAGTGRARPAPPTSDFVVADVQTEGLGPEPFDLAVSQLGVMFFDEPLAAFGAIRAGLRAGRAPRLRLLAGGGAEPVAHRHRAAPVRPAAARCRRRARARWARSASGTTSTCATSSVAPGSATSRARGRDHGAGARPARWSTARCSGSWACPRAAGRGRGGDRQASGTFAVGADEYEYPLAFRVYEAVNG